MSSPVEGADVGGSNPYVRTPAIGIQHGVERDREVGEVAVVDATVVELASEVVQQPGPVSAGRRGGAAATSTRRSTTLTAARPDSAARACSHARCRQDGEHHFGIRPRAFGCIGVPHQPQVVAARRRSVTSAGSSVTVSSVTALARRAAPRG
jgi:hypothetical protein